MNAGTRWALAPVALLVLCITGQVILVTASNAAPGLSVEPHYYEKAQGWDQRQAQERRVQELGWEVAVDLPTSRELHVRLTDRTAAPLTGAQVEVITLHAARPDRRTLVTLREQAPGRYVGPARFDAPGAWELQVDVRRDGERTQRTFVREVAVATAPKGADRQ